MRPTWEQYAFALAKTAAMRSEDPYVKVGACALRHDHSVAGCGYNGTIRGVQIDWLDREGRRDKVIHAEQNCLNYCKPGEVEMIAVNIPPCPRCLVTIASYGIKKIVHGPKEGWENTDPRTFELAKEFGIEMIEICEK